MIAARIIILQINHFSINVLDEFAEEKINKLSVFFGNHCVVVVSLHLSGNLKVIYFNRPQDCRDD